MSILLKILLAVSSFSHTEYDCLTEAVYYEAGNQSIAGKASVAHVIKNRVEDSRWSSTFCGVVRERGQFSYYWDGKPEPMPKKDNRFEWVALFESQVVSLSILLLPLEDITHGSLYYHNDKIEPPYWASEVTQITQIDNHILYTD